MHFDQTVRWSYSGNERQRQAREEEEEDAGVCTRSTYVCLQPTSSA